MIDRYTKVVLTVIAAALTGIFIQGLVSSANAQRDAVTVKLAGIEPHSGTLPITIRAVEQDKLISWDAIKVRQ